MSSIVIALCLYLGASALAMYLLWVLWKRVANWTEFLAIVVVGFACFIQLTPGLGWCLGLLPPLNDPDQPYVTGIGGAAYGLDYETYPWAALFFIASSCGCLLVGYLFIPRKRFRPLFHPIRDLRNRIGQPFLRNAAVWGVIAAVLYLVISYSLLGWESLWNVDILRKEFTGRIIFGFVDHRVLVLGAFLLSLPMVVVVLLGDFHVRWTAVIAIVLFALPSVALGSRRGSVLLVAIVLILTLRSKRRKLLLGPAILLCGYLYLLPLVMRLEVKEGSGLYHVGRASAILLDPKAFDLNKQLIRVLFNYGQGFGVFVEFLEQEMDGNELLAGVPWSYYPISLSPFPSLVDGYQMRYFMYHARVNIYTPYNGYSEIASLNLVLGVLLVPALVAMCVLLLKFIGGGNPVRWSACVIVVAGAVLMLLHLQQYNLRQASRFFVYPVDIALLLWLVFGNYKTARRTVIQKVPVEFGQR